MPNPRDTIILGDIFTTWAQHAYGDRQYHSRHPPTEEHQATWYALLPPRKSAQAKCTFREDTSRCEASCRLKRTHSGSTLRSVNCIYEDKSYGQSKSTYPTVFHTVHELYIWDVNGEAMHSSSYWLQLYQPPHGAPRLLQQLGLPTEPNTSPLSLLITR
jgi:hypothetical protein